MKKHFALQFFFLFNQNLISTTQNINWKKLMTVRVVTKNMLIKIAMASSMYAYKIHNSLSDSLRSQ